MIVDSHAHFVPAVIADQVHDGLPHNVSDADLLALLDAAGVDKLVEVTPSAMHFDNRHGIAVARAHPDRVRIVAALNATMPNAPSTLRALADEPHVVGVRVLVLADGVSVLDGHGLDPVWAVASDVGLPVCVYAPGAAAPLARLAARFPQLPLVVDHACLDLLPGTATAERVRGWDDLQSLVAHANVSVKVSGIPEATEERFPYPRGARLLAQLCGWFGPERLMWGSNYPPSARAGSYAEQLEWLRDRADLSATAREQILRATACRVFRLPWT
jgi:L-fuconolactonase